jgi:hypothetical protein
VLECITDRLHSWRVARERFEDIPATSHSQYDPCVNT